MAKSQQDFAALDKEIWKDAKVFTMFYGIGADDFINWEILRDAEHHIDTDFVPPSDTNVMKDFDFEWPLIDNFFDPLFPSIKGHARIIDKYLSDSRASYPNTMKADKI